MTHCNIVSYGTVQLHYKATKASICCYLPSLLPTHLPSLLFSSFLLSSLTSFLPSFLPSTLPSQLLFHFYTSLILFQMSLHFLSFLYTLFLSFKSSFFYLFPILISLSLTVWKTESWTNEQTTLQNRLDKSANPVLTVATITKIRNDLFKISRSVTDSSSFFSVFTSPLLSTLFFFF